MGRNNIQNLPPNRLTVAARVFCEAATADPGALGLREADLEAIGAARTRVEADLRAVNAAQATYKAALVERRGNEAALAALLARAANLVYAQPNLETSAVVGLGLSPRKKTRTPAVPRTPIGLWVRVVAEGVVILAWERGENAEETIFVVESRVGAGDWSHATSVTRTRVRLAPVSPGTEFRVRASKGGRMTPPSNVVSVYAPA